jgi:hypothetical protein
VPTETLSDSQFAIVEWLTRLRDVTRNNGLPGEFAYAGIGDFLLQHGVWYEPVPFPASVQMGAPKSCYGNALLLAIQRGYRYVEGYASANIEQMPFPVHHAWSLDAEGNLIDNTWGNTGLAYLGVEFSRGRAENAVWYDNSNVLDNIPSRFRIFREPWTGENYNLRWRRSNKIRRLMRELEAI